MTDVTLVPVHTDSPRGGRRRAPPATTACVLGWASLALGGLALLGSCSAYSSTTRVYASGAVEERPIRPEAYAAYLSAAAHEFRGENEQARAEYQIALDNDAKSPEILTRLAHLTCELDYIEALDLFGRARDLDETFEPALQLAARCALSHGDNARALSLARTALTAFPLACDTTAVLADALKANKQAGAAERLLAAYHARLGTDEAPVTRPQPPKPEAPLCEVPVKRWGDRHGAPGRVVPLDAAWHDLDQGQSQRALNLAKRLLNADPSDHNARILVLVASERLGDRVAFTQALEAPALERATTLTARSRQELLSLVQRRTGYPAAPP